MIFLKWLILAALDWALLLTVPAAALIVPCFTRAMPYGQRPYSWGWIWGTWDNPPQGDQGYLMTRAPFPGVVWGWRGYLNRCMWMIRNPLYGYAKRASIQYSSDLQLAYVGNPNISDKAKVPGWYYATVRDGSDLVAFELYVVAPWGFGRCLRMRLGWKVMTDKFQRYGFAQLVNTCNPFDGYGDA